MSPPLKKNKLSKQCANNWWKLKVEDRRKHNHLMKVQLLSPFLFSKVYQDEMWVEWAKSAGLLSQKRTSAMDDLTVEEFYNTDLVEHAITKLQDEIMEHNEYNANVPMTQFLEEIMDDIDGCEEIEALSKALSDVKEKPWFKSVSSQLIGNKSSEEKCNAAAFLAAWQVCFYMKSVYNGEKPLETFSEDSYLDEQLEKNKESGNEYFKKEEYSKAISSYTKILYAKPYIHVVYGNRAACYLRKQEFRFALADGRRATTLQPTYGKGQYRYAQALYELGHNEAALKVLSKALEVCEEKEHNNFLQLQNKISSETETFKIKNSVLNDNDGGNDSDWDDIENDDDGDNMPELKTETEESDDEDKTDVPDLLSASDNSSDEDDIIEQPTFNHRKKSKEQSKTKKPDHLVGSFFNEKTCGERAEKRAAERKADRDKIEREKLAKLLIEEEKTVVVKQKVKEKTKKKRKKKNKEKVSLDPLKIKEADLTLAMKEGTVALLDHRGRNAAHEYKKAVSIIQVEPVLLTRQQSILLHYAHATSYLEVGSHLELMEALKIFVEINSNFADMNFPLAFFGIGKIYFKQNRFQKVSKLLHKALAMDDSPDCLRMCSWPGVNTIIEETKPGKLKVAVNSLLQLCIHPPKPDGICRYTLCRQETTVIYFTDPDFKGFVRMLCSEKCSIEFHSMCWKKYKTDMDRHCEKEFLTGCLTPDCLGLIHAVQIYEDANGKIKVEFKNDPITTPKDTKNVEKTKKLTNGSRNEKKRKKKENKLNTDVVDTNNDICELVDNIEQIASEKGNEEKVEVLQNGTKPATLEDGGEMYVLKKNDDNDDLFFQKGKGKKIKTKKVQKPKVILDIPYVGSDKSRIEDVPCDVVSEPAEHDNWHTDFNPYIIDNSNSIKEGFDFSLYNNLVPDAKGTALHCFSMFEQMLEVKGCADVHNSPDIIELYNILDENSKLLIANVGGLRTFLSKCTKFSFDKKNRNVVYLTSQEAYYELCKDNVRQSNNLILPPKCDKPLFVDRLDTKSSDCLSAIKSNVTISQGTQSKSPKKESEFSKNKTIITCSKNSKTESESIEITNSEIDAAEDKELEDIGKILEAYGDKNKKLRIETIDVRGSIKNPDTVQQVTNIILNKVKSLRNEEDKPEVITINNGKKETKKICTECSEVVIDEYMCLCTDPVTYKIEKEKKHTAYFGIGIFRPSQPPHGKPEYEVVDIMDIKESRTDKRGQRMENISEKCGTKKKTSTPSKINPSESLKKKDLVEDKNEIKLEMKTNEQPLCVVHVGIQTDMMKDDHETFTRQNNALVEANHRFIDEVRSCRDKYEKVLDDVHKQKVKFNMAQDHLQTELDEHKKRIEKMKKEAMRQQQTRESDIKRLNNDKKEFLQQIKNLQKKLDASNEEEYKADLLIKTKEIEKLQRELIELRDIHEQEKLEQEAIVCRSITLCNEQTERAQRVEVAFLENQKVVVAAKYTQQASIIQNSMNQLQFFPQSPETQMARSMFENYKKHFQDCYDKMQEEFVTLITLVKDGDSLESIPPAKYAEPPSPPKLPLNKPSISSQVIAQRMQMMQQQQQQQMQHHQQQQQLPIVMPSITTPIIPLPQTTTISAPITNLENKPSKESVPVSSASATSVTSGYQSDSDGSETSSGTSSSRNDELRTNDRRLVMRLASLIPNSTREELHYFVQEYRRKHGSLSGMKFEDVVKNIEKMIRLSRGEQHHKQQIACLTKEGSRKKVSPRSPNAYSQEPVLPSRVHNTYTQDGQVAAASTKRTRANHTPDARMKHTSSSAYNAQEPWLEAVPRPLKSTVFGHEEPCIICYEDMTNMTSLKLHCGHVFHKNCISCWLNEQRTCPICRVHALLPEEYPALV